MSDATPSRETIKALYQAERDATAAWVRTLVAPYTGMAEATRNLAEATAVLDRALGVVRS